MRGNSPRNGMIGTGARDRRAIWISSDNLFNELLDASHCRADQMRILRNRNHCSDLDKRRDM